MQIFDAIDNNSADKVWSKNDKGWTVPSLMPIRVNSRDLLTNVLKSVFKTEEKLTKYLFTKKLIMFFHSTM